MKVTMLDIWRVHYTKGSSNGSWGNVQLLEGRENAEERIFTLLCEARATHVRKSANQEERERSSWFRRWLKGVEDRTPPELGAQVLKVQSVKRLRSDGEWIEIAVEVEPPRLVMEQRGDDDEQ